MEIGMGGMGIGMGPGVLATIWGGRRRGQCPSLLYLVHIIEVCPKFLL